MSGTLIINGATFSGNDVGEAGAILIWYSAVQTSIENTVIMDHHSLGLVGGVSSRSLTGPVTIHHSCLIDNTPLNSAVWSEWETVQVDARENWWGTADGPSNEGPGSGDGVGWNVLFAPFLTAVPPLCDALPAPTATPTQTPTPSRTPLPSRTPTITYTPGPTYTPSPTRTVDPAYLSSSGCVPLSDPAGTILCTQ
jgi:hypothetical protein